MSQIGCECDVVGTCCKLQAMMEVDNKQRNMQHEQLVVKFEQNNGCCSAPHRCKQRKSLVFKVEQWVNLKASPMKSLCCLSLAPWHSVGMVCKQQATSRLTGAMHAGVGTHAVFCKKARTLMTS